MERRPWFEALAFTIVAIVAMGLLAGVRRVSGPPSGALPAQATAAATEEPTEVPPTPVPVPETPPASGSCIGGLPSPRFAWTLHVTVWDEATGLGMWVPRGDNAGPYLKAYAKAKYGDTWYGATFLPDGRMVPDAAPPWPRPDLIRSGAAGIQTSRAGSPTCGRTPERPVPPCVVEVVYPLVFLDKLDEDGPYLTRTYFWAPSSQRVSDAGRPAQVGGAPFSETDCDARAIWPRMASSRPAYGLFNGCGSASTRVDTCYAIGLGEYTPGRDGRMP